MLEIFWRANARQFSRPSQSVGNVLAVNDSPNNLNFNGVMEKPWSHLASRVVRVTLARKGIKTGDVPELLTKADKKFKIEGQALSELIAKERVDLELFLRILVAIDDAIPERWDKVLSDDKKPWKALGASIVAEEASNYPSVDINELTRRMNRFHKLVPGASWQTKILEGDMSLAEFMALLHEMGSTSLSQYLDWKDIVAAARVARESAQ